MCAIKYISLKDPDNMYVNIQSDTHMKAALPSSKLCPLVPVPDLPQRHMMRPHLLTK